MDNTTVTCKKITDKYYKINYLGLNCIMDISNGYINVSKFYPEKSKRITTYLDRIRYKIFASYYISNITQYSADLSIEVTDVVKKAKGMYLHPILFLDLANWISPTVYHKAIRIISDVFIKEINVEDKLENIENTLTKVLRD
jgi:hypothetical protein